MKRRRIKLYCTVLFCVCTCAGLFGLEIARGQNSSAHLSAKRDSSPREILALMGLDDEFFAGFTEGTPLDEAEREKLMRLLFRLQKMSPAVLESHANSMGSLSQIERTPDAHRGEVYLLRFHVQRLERQEVPDSLREMLGFEHYFMCDLDAYGSRYTLCAQQIPAAWKVGQAIDEQGSAMAMFVKELPARAIEPQEDEASGEGGTQAKETPNYLFVASRVAWHPQTLLGHLGMDYGLFDGVTDKTSLSEREPFYRMLAIAKQMSPDYLDYQIKGRLKEDAKLSERLVRNRDLPAKMRADAERTWERVQDGASDVVPLFNEPDKQRGNFVILRGEALRAIKVRVDDEDIVKRFGIDHYYEIEMVTPDSQNNPIVCCVTEIPATMPLGDSIHEDVRIAGFFLKSWAFDTRASGGVGKDGKSVPRQQQLAPLVIGKRVDVFVRPRIGMPTQSITLAVALSVVLAITAASMWFIYRSDRRGLAQMADHRGTLPEEISIETMPTNDGTDR